MDQSPAKCDQFSNCRGDLTTDCCLDTIENLEVCGVKFLEDLIENHENMIERHKTAITSITNKINNLRKEEHISNLLNYLDLSFETEEMSDAFDQWCCDNI